MYLKKTHIAYAYECVCCEGEGEDAIFFINISFASTSASQFIQDELILMY